MVPNPVSSTEAAFDAAEAKAAALEKEALLQRLRQRYLQAADLNELGFVIVNDTWHWLQYQQAVFVQQDGLGRLKVRTVSGLATVSEESPFTVWLGRITRLAQEHFREPGPVRLEASMFETEGKNSWAEWWPAHAVWVPLLSDANAQLGSVWFVRDHPWQDDELRDLKMLARSWVFYLQTLSGPPSLLGRAKQLLKSRSRTRLGLAIAAIALCVPVRLSVMAPAEVVPLQAISVSAPMEGVVKAFAIPPNASVRKGDLLFSLDDTTLRNRRDVAQKSLEVSRADALATQQKAFDSVQSKGELATLSGRVREREAELAYLGEALTRVEVRAALDGIFVYSDPNDWLGKPVVTGERIGQLAEPQDLGVLVWLPVGDAINLEAGADMRVYLQVAPLTSLSAKLVQSSYQATLSPDGVASYRVRGKLEAGQEARIGMRGMAKIYGDWRPLVYWILRRPLGAARQWLGL